MTFTVSKLNSIEECDAMTEVINQLKQDLSVSELVDRAATQRIAKRAEQSNKELAKLNTQLASWDAQLAVVSDPATVEGLTHLKMTGQAKKYGIEIRTKHSANGELLLKELDIATAMSEQEHLTTMLAAIAARKAALQ